MKWGILDTTDNVWIGNDDGPLTYDVEDVARVAAQMADVMLQQEPGRCRAKEYTPGPYHLRDEKKTAMTPEAAIKGMEEGLV